MIYLVKGLVNKLISVIPQRVYPRPDGRDLYFPSKFEKHFHSTFRRYLDKAFGLLDREIFNHKLSQKCDRLLVSIYSSIII